MSAAAAAPQPNPTAGYAQIPNSIVENQVLFTPAELALMLIVIRRGGPADHAVPVSDDNWQNWTGLNPRSKEYAVNGLRKKGLRIEGHGQKAKFAFDRASWHTYVKTCDRRERPKTQGRVSKPVAAKPGAMVHPECREKGCALLRAQGQSGLSLVPATNFAQPVAPASAGFGAIGATGCSASEQHNPQQGQNGLTLIPAIKVAQPVAQNVLVTPKVTDATDAAEQVWAKTLAVLQAAFPLIGVVFLVRLVAVCRAMFADLSDTELSQAVGFAWNSKKATQKSEGLFLLTVPEALARVRKRKPVETPPDLTSGVRLLLERCRAGLAERGAPFKAHAFECARILASIQDWSQADALVKVEGELERLESQVIETAKVILNSSQRNAVQSCVSERISPYEAKLDRANLEKLRLQIEGREILTVLGIPRMTALYA